MSSVTLLFADSPHSYEGTVKRKMEKREYGDFSGPHSRNIKIVKQLEIEITRDIWEMLKADVPFLVNQICTVKGDNLPEGLLYKIRLIEYPSRLKKGIVLYLTSDTHTETVNLKKEHKSGLEKLL